jgi:hypothetical protein
MVEMQTNPYATPCNTAQHRTRVLSRHDIAALLVWLVAYFYPMLALCGIYIVVFMHGTLELPGAIFGSYKTPMGIVFNLSIWLLIGVLFICPAGLIWSFFPPAAVRRSVGSRTLLLPFGYLLIVALTIVMVFWDPWRVVETYQD